MRPSYLGHELRQMPLAKSGSPSCTNAARWEGALRAAATEETARKLIDPWYAPDVARLNKHGRAFGPEGRTPYFCPEIAARACSPLLNRRLRAKD